MVELRILSGKQAGTSVGARRFPFRVGRRAADLELEDEGVFEQHLEIRLGEDQRFEIQVLPPAMAAVNGVPVETAPLRNGDLIECGLVQLRFGMSAPPQRSLKLRETLTWIALGALGFIQVALIYWLLE